MTLMPIYTAQWEMKVATKDLHQVEAQQRWRARALWLAGKTKEEGEGSRRQLSTLKGLLIPLRQAGA